MNKALVEPARYAPSFDAPQSVKKFGVITLATDLTTERDFARLLPLDKAGYFGTRVAYENPTTPENLRKMAPNIATAAALILPGETLEAICYSCTAASVVIGDAEVGAAIHATRPGVPVVTPSSAALMAFETMGVKRVSILTPYVVETSERMAVYFAANGLEIVRFACMGIEDDREMARVSQATIIDNTIAIDDPRTEAFFLSCTALPAISAIAEIEARTGKPVVTSNQASAWAMMCHAGLEDMPKGYGRLFDFRLPSGRGA